MCLMTEGQCTDSYVHVLGRAASTSTAWLSFWAIEEAAKHCVAARMSTHLGNATNSFAAFEKALHAAVHGQSATQGRRQRQAQDSVML